MKRSTHIFGWKQGVCAAVVILFLVVVGIGIFSLRKVEPPLPDAPEAPAKPAAAETEPVEEPAKLAVGEISDEEIRLNTFLDAFVQQNIENSQTDLDEDAELIRFVFGYRKVNDPKSVVEWEIRAVTLRVLTLEQVNETLTQFLGKTISPDRQDYSIQINETDCFRCVFEDGCFWNISPFPTERFSFPLRFALVRTIDPETSTLYFNLYKLNPDVWGVGDAERHVFLTPSMSIFLVESTDNRIIKIGEGKAVLRDLDEQLLLEELKITMYH